MENINTIKFFIVTVIFFMLIVSFLFNRLVTEHDKKEKYYKELLNKLSKENYELRVYKTKKEFSNKVIQNMKNATKKNS